MKKMSLIILLVLGMAFTALAYQNEPDNFRGMKWGSPRPSSVHPMVGGDPKSASSITICHRHTDKLSVGEATLTAIVYVYYKNKLNGVVLYFEGITNFVSLKSTLSQAYGKPYQSNEYIEDYKWLNQDGLCIVIKYSEITGKGDITYMYMPISNKQTQDRDEASLEGKKDL